jgi:hypothetical protein
MVLAVQLSRNTGFAGYLLLAIGIMGTTARKSAVVRDTGPFRELFSSGPFLFVSGARLGVSWRARRGRRKRGGSARRGLVSRGS